ncbi:MAG TPA: hypothetical protein VFU07_04935 [Candidatus Lumbricidophila sp.]|nr:hypothetical protein [Candidatus Lumbricidophila sp.]
MSNQPKPNPMEDELTAVVDLIAGLTVGLVDSDGDKITFPIGSNAAVEYRTEQFAIRDYCWCAFGDGYDRHDYNEAEDGPMPNPERSTHTTPDGMCPPNFEHFKSGLKLDWYKRRGRSNEWYGNLPTTREQVIDILLDCLKPLATNQPSLPHERREPAAK